MSIYCSFALSCQMMIHHDGIMNQTWICWYNDKNICKEQSLPAAFHISICLLSYYNHFLSQCSWMWVIMWLIWIGTGLLWSGTINKNRVGSFSKWLVFLYWSYRSIYTNKFKKIIPDFLKESNKLININRFTG